MLTDGAKNGSMIIIFYFQMGFWICFSEKICCTQKTGFWSKNRKKRFWGLLKRNSAGKWLFSAFWAQNRCFWHDIWNPVDFLHLFFGKKYVAPKKPVFDPKTAKNGFWGFQSGIQPENCFFQHFGPKINVSDMIFKILMTFCIFCFQKNFYVKKVIFAS